MDQNLLLNELLYLILDFLEFSEMPFNCFSMLLKYCMHVSLKVNDITRCTMKNSSPLPTLLQLESKQFQLFIIFFAFMLLYNMQLFPYFFFSDLVTFYQFFWAADENSVLLPYPFAPRSSHPTFLLSILPM